MIRLRPYGMNEGAGGHEGPAVIESDNTTIWLPPGASGELAAYGNLKISTGGGR